ncbi:hypothetical protein R5R35_003718 [Gryllus longicercus]|uniref:Oxidoreductase-like domain-containing protein n=1 Tax=Gryllus longicercus TaxID=2509291 RepID=A0AAN9ZDF0_9ORTH
MANVRCLEIRKILRFSYNWQSLEIARNVCSEKNNLDSNDVEVPEPPTTCCNSGCDSCVWIEYAEELLKKCKNGGDIAKNVIIQKVTDPSMKAFLLAELKELEKEHSIN